MNKNIPAIGIIFLFTISAVTPIVFGYNVRTSNEQEIQSTTSCDGGLMDSAWPMYCHDTRHTGRSQYSTAGNPIKDKWWFKVPYIFDFINPNFINIANDGTIYLTCYDGNIYALYQNGTLKWTLDESNVSGKIECHPAIDENGTIYFGTSQGLFYAINPNGTIKWKYISSSPFIFSSPAIGDNGIIYFVDLDYLSAMFPNGTIKWRYEPYSAELYSSPAIADDGTIYCCGYGHLYSIYPNGTLNWKTKLQDWIPNSPSIAEDGTVYISSYDDYLYALDPNNGNIKWEYPIGGELFNANPSLGDDGTIYLIGFDEPDYYFYAVNPDGTKRGTSKLDTDYRVDNSNPMISADGTIYVAGGDCFYAFQPNGIERWCKRFDIPFYFVTTSPVIGEDGTIYLGLVHFTEKEKWEFDFTLFLHAFDKIDSNAPSAPEITGPLNGIPDMNYNYTIVSTDPNGDDIYYYVCWGEESYAIPMGPWVPSKLEEFGPYPSGEEITLNYTWTWKDDFTIKVIAKDTNNLLSQWSELTVTITKTRQFTNPLVMRFLGRFTILQRFLSLLIN